MSTEYKGSVKSITSIIYYIKVLLSDVPLIKSLF